MQEATGVRGLLGTIINKGSICLDVVNHMEQYRPMNRLDNEIPVFDFYKVWYSKVSNITRDRII